MKNYLSSPNSGLQVSLLSSAGARTLLITLLLIGLASGCASNSATVDAVAPPNPYFQNAINAMEIGAYEEADRALDTALVQYQAKDDILGQWQVYNLKTKVALQQADLESAQRDLIELQSLAELLSSDAQSYETLLLSGRVLDDKKYYQQALNYARDSLSQSVVLTYLGDNRKAMSLLEQNSSASGDRNADKAFVNYEYGRVMQSRAHLLSSLSYYRAAADSRGIADALMALAIHSASEGRTNEAIDLALRAKTTLLAIGDEKRANAVSIWLEEIRA